MKIEHRQTGWMEKTVVEHESSWKKTWNVKSFLSNWNLMNIFSSSANSFSLIRSLPLPTFMFECVTFLRLWRCLSRFWRFPFLSQFVSRSLRWRILFKHQFNFQKMPSCQIYTTRYDSHWAERTYAGESSGSNKKNVCHQSCFVRILNSTNLTTWNWEWDNIEQHII